MAKFTNRVIFFRVYSWKFYLSQKIFYTSVTCDFCDKFRVSGPLAQIENLTRIVSSLEYMDARWRAEYCSLQIFNLQRRVLRKQSLNTFNVVKRQKLKGGRKKVRKSILFFCSHSHLLAAKGSHPRSTIRSIIVTWKVGKLYQTEMQKDFHNLASLWVTCTEGR